jgi:hypothetical protein
LEGNSGTLLMSIFKVENEEEKRLYRVKLIEKSKLNLNLDVTFDYDQSVSSFYSVPMSPDKTSYFSNLKKSALIISGVYKYGSQ